MSQVMTFAGVPLAVAMSFGLALGIEVVLLGSAIRMMSRAVARSQSRMQDGRQSSAR